MNPGTRPTGGRWLHRLRPVATPRVRLVCLPHAGGSAAFYRPWRERLPADVELDAVQYPGRLDRITEPCVDDMDTLADAVTEAVEPLSDRPVALFGHSLGAALGYEVTRRLERRDRGPVRLFASGRPAPDRPLPGDKHLADDDVLWHETCRLNGTRPEVVADPALRAAFLPALRSDYRLIETYRPRPGPPLRCPITVLVGDRDGEVDVAQARRWSALTRAGADVRVFPGDHFYLVEQLPRVVEEVLARLSGVAPDRDDRPAWIGLETQGGYL